MLEYLKEKLPEVTAWIDTVLKEHRSQAVTVQSLKFARLPLYFTDDRLVKAKVVVVEKVPVIPLSEMGLTMFRGFEQASYKGITYRDTYFIEGSNASFESVHFHELVHVVQWERLGDDFLLAYGQGFLAGGYYSNPLEGMAYAHQQRFLRNGNPYAVEPEIIREIDEVVTTVRL